MDRPFAFVAQFSEAGERRIRRSFDPGFRIELHQKDRDLVLQSAQSVSPPDTATVQELFDA